VAECEICSMEREWCEHGLRDRRLVVTAQAADVFVLEGTTKNEKYHRIDDCAGIQVGQKARPGARAIRLSRESALDEGRDACSLPSCWPSGR